MKMQLLALTPLALTLMGAEDAPDALSLQGTWTMDAAYEVQANGTRTTNYGEHPSGLMIVGWIATAVMAGAAAAMCLTAALSAIEM